MRTAAADGRPASPGVGGATSPGTNIRTWLFTRTARSHQLRNDRSQFPLIIDNRFQHEQTCLRLGVTVAC